MVDGISNLPGSGIPQVQSKPRTSSTNTGSAGSETSSRSSDSSSSRDSAVVVEVSSRSRDINQLEAAIAEVNKAAAGSEAPTTQELTLALNADTVAAALGNTVDISV